MFVNVNYNHAADNFIASVNNNR